MIDQPAGRPVERREDAIQRVARAMLAKLDIILPKVDGMIAFNFARTRTQYDGPNLAEELAELRELLAASPVPCAEPDDRGGVRSDVSPDAGGGSAVEDTQDRAQHERGLGGSVSDANGVQAALHSATHADAPPLAAEGERDEMPTSETRTSNGPTRGSAVGIVADAGLHDLQGEANRGSSVGSVACETDYLRGYATALIDAIAAIEFARDKGGKEDAAFDGMNCAVFALRQMRPPPVAVSRDPHRLLRFACMDCGLAYENKTWPIDVVLPDADWQRIHPAVGGVLCPACIVNRVAKLPDVTVLFARIVTRDDAHAFIDLKNVPLAELARLRGEAAVRQEE